jgi:hypothetical protein
LSFIGMCTPLLSRKSLARPKSIRYIIDFSDSSPMQIFSGLRSRWMKPSECRSCSRCNICTPILRTEPIERNPCVKHAYAELVHELLQVQAQKAHYQIAIF